MASIYVHIPFCKSRCSYCDFYSECDISVVDELIKCEIKEINSRREYADNEIIKSIYFGGGTPSLLLIKNVCNLIKGIREGYSVSKDVEITFEANPEDLEYEYIVGLVKYGINRFSVGIQGFNDDILKILDRRHTVGTSIKSIEMIKEAGVDNISVDLIYGIPGMSFSSYKESVHELIKLNVCHISAYNLTYHDGTKIKELVDFGIYKEVSEEECFSQFSYLYDLLKKHGYINYELSNFAKDGQYSRHNSSYWLGEKYIGIGPSAHSYNGGSRQWNISSVNKYIQEVRDGGKYYEIENLSLNDKYNEYIITRLRTMWGISLKDIFSNYGEEYSKYILDKIKRYSPYDYLIIKNGIVRLTKKGLFISDMIMKDFVKI